MGIHDLVAKDVNDFTRIGVHLVTDDPARLRIRSRILVKCHKLFRDESVITAWENVLLESVLLRASALQNATFEL